MRRRPSKLGSGSRASGQISAEAETVSYPSLAPEQTRCKSDPPSTLFPNCRTVKARAIQPVIHRPTQPMTSEATQPEARQPLSPRPVTARDPVTSRAPSRRAPLAPKPSGTQPVLNQIRKHPKQTLCQRLRRLRSLGCLIWLLRVLNCTGDRSSSGFYRATNTRTAMHII